MSGGRRTLVIVPNWVGDVVMAQPVLAALAASGRRLTALARPHLAPLLGLLPEVANTLPREPSTGATVERLRGGRFDEAVLLPRSFRAAWLAFRAGVPERCGYRGDLRSPLLTRAVARPRDGRPQIEDYRELLAALGVEAPASWVPRIAATAEILRTGGERLARAAIDPGGGRLVGLFPGAEFGPSKRWPVERFGQLGHRLRRRVPGLRQVIVAGPRETWLAVRVHELSGKLAPVVGPDLDLAALAGVMARLDLLITNDSGPMHLAAALGVPCVALFGPTDPRRTAPAGEGHAVLYTDRWCSPCFRRRCPLLHHRCLKDLGVEAVAEAAAASLGR